MFLSYLTLAVAISLSVIAAYYSIAGLTAIFAAAVVPIIVMGSILELAKVVATLWLHEYWGRCKFAMKAYLVPAVVILMTITSMGIFGFLSKAHSDQSLVSGDVLAKISIYDEKIKIERDNIANAREVIKQLDDAVNGINAKGSDREIKLRDGSSYTRSAAEQALQVRRSQAKDRAKLTKDIEEAQAKIVKLQEEAAPIRAEVRKVEAEVGPIKYIAALVYGDNPDANLLERAVRWVIILLVTVFDPLAIMMLLAATESLKWARESKSVDTFVEQAAEDILKDIAVEESAAEQEKSILEQHPYLNQPFAHFENLKPMVAEPVKKTINDFVPQPQELIVDDDDHEDDHPLVKAAQSAWKKQNPGKTLKEQRTLLERGLINELPWMVLIPEQPRMPETGFGPEFPAQPKKGDVYVRTDKMPNQAYKFNGTAWIVVDKNKTDNYTYNEAYIDHLITKIDSGEYDIDLLTESEQEQIAQRLHTRNT